MPFTLAHAATALPFRRSRLVFSAVLVGTLAPDFEYFIRFMPEGHRFGHTMLGTFVLTLPLSFLVLWLFHAFVKAPTARLLPEALHRRLASQFDDFRFGGTGRFLLIVASLLVGIATHILWDSFTHRESWFALHWAFLRQPIGLPMLGPRPLFRALQYISTIAGLLILAAWFTVWYSSRQPKTDVSGEAISAERKVLTVAALLSIAFVGALGRAFSVTGIPITGAAQRKFFAYMVVSTISFLWCELVLYGVLSSVRAITAKPEKARSLG